MGKWTAEYYDDVLGAKMRSLVSGAIKRARLEKMEPMITYEAFVEDLDRGDSFTTSLIEVLVKEVAERRHRQNAADRGLIADRTARSLRRLSSPASVYRERGPGRGTGGRRGVDLAEYLSQPPDELDMDEDEDELGPYSAFVPFVEGARLNTDLYEAYRSHLPTESTNDRVLPPLVDASPPSAWPLPSATGVAHSSLTRQASIRRAGRSRASDFSDFTAQRRNSARQLAQDREPTAGTDLIATDEHYPRDTDDVTHPPPVHRSSQVRRFFPFGRARRFEVIPTPRPATSTSDDWFFPPHSGWSAVSERAGGEDDEDRSQAPRLRRGGVRAPESILSGRTLPHIDLPSPPELVRSSRAAPATGGNGDLAVEAPTRNAPEETVQSTEGH
ncbi:hypothetical protein F5I97DRAFT_1859688 [Phlebopus sp. FC_14]|nr:hypothetical protein F5I97DRAFT_1859688 [Phlebopus sp. FC_14]